MLTLVTGATGLVGAALVRQLVAAGEAVRILRRPSSPLDLLGAAAARIEHAEGDVTDPDAVRDAVRGARRVYHAAALLDFGGRRAEMRLFDVNAGGTAHVVDAALEEGIERLVHVSSIAALGRPDSLSHPGGEIGGAIDEDAEWRPSRANSAYARSKHAAELEVQRGVAEGLDATIVNPALVFGVGRRGEGTMRIVARVRRGAMRTAPPGGTCVVDAEDVAAGMRAAMARGRTGARYVLGAENLPWTEVLAVLAAAFGQARPRRVVTAGTLLAGALLAEMFARLTGSRPKLSREQARAGSETHQYDNRRAVEELGVTFRPFRETAARIAEEIGDGG